MPICVFQDSHGFIWIGDQGGLVKYDGYTLKRYEQIPFDTTSLSNNWIKDIKEDSKGNLWIATHGGGINCFDQKKEKFTHYHHDPEAQNSLGSNNINKIIVNDDNSLWIGTWDNGFTYMSLDCARQPKYWQYTNHNLPADIPLYTILDMYKDDKGYLWLGTAGLGLQRFNLKTEEIKSYLHDPNDLNSISNNFVSSVCEDDSGYLWIGTGFYVIETGGGLNMFNRHMEEFKHFRHNPKDPNSLGSDIVTSLLIDKDKGLWIGTTGNGVQFIPLKELSKDQSPKFRKMGGNSVNSIYEDNLGNIWISSNGFYVHRYDYQQNPFYYVKYIKDNPNSLSASNALCVLIDRAGDVWVGHTNTGVSRFNPITKKFKHYRYNLQNQNSISENWIKAICEDSEGNIWIGTATSGIDILNPVDGTFTHFKADAKDSTALFSNLIQWLLPSFTGDIWIAFNKSGLQLYDKKNKRFIKFDIDPNSVEEDEIMSLYEDQSGKLWIGTFSNGLYGITLKDRKINTVEHFTYDIQDTLGLINNRICDIIEDNKLNALWIATTGGMNFLDLNIKKFSYITDKDGLPTTFLLKLLQDNKGDLWITTTDGISRYNPATGYIKNYDQRDGLPHTSFGTGRRNTAIGTDGRLYFGGGGIIVFDPEEIKDNPNIPPVRLTDFKIFHQSVRLDTFIQFKKRIILDSDQNVFSFNFSALNFTNPPKNQYAYKMEGLLDDWINIGTERTASFTNLDPGEYIFRVKGSNNHGVWNEQGASINITILPPWWRTYWAYTSYIILILILLYSIRKYDLKRQRLKNELVLEHEQTKKLQEIGNMKSRFFANISHEFRTPLTLILGPIEKLLSKAGDSDSQSELSMMQRNAKRLQRLINQLLDLSKLESGSMTIQVSKVNIVNLVYNYIQSFESLARRKGIDLRFKSEENMIPAFVDKEKFEKVLNNLLSNAFKFTDEGGSVEVTISRSNDSLPDKLINSDYILIKVSDTGIGIPSSRLDNIFDRFYQIENQQKYEHEGTGIGLALTKELVELHHGKIIVKSKLGKGTTFSIYIPAGKDHFKDNEIVDDLIDDGITDVKEKIKLKESEDAYEFSVDDKQSMESETEKSTILIIEDNPDMRVYIQDCIGEKYKTLESEDGQQGFDKAIESIPDLIISDVMMPKMDGFELSAKLKTDERTSHIPVILLTARAESDDKIEGLQTGVDDYLIKPFDGKELLVRINNLIKLRQKLRERYHKELILNTEDFDPSTIDEQFLSRLIKICNKYLVDSSFNIELLSAEIGLSRSQLHRKLKGLTGQSATEFIKTLRLKRAAVLIQKHQDNISQIAYEVGFNNLSYFAKSFKELYGQTPQEYSNSSKH